MNARTFEFTTAKRTATPFSMGIVGPSSSGKTFSALRLATGMQRVTGGDIFGVDTEAKRMLHYAGQFKFKHAVFSAPFGPLDYLAVIERAVALGAKTIIVDSMSHEHEGPGGVLEQHHSETERLAKLWRVSMDKAQMPAWAEPKAARRRLLNTIVQLPCNFIFCFRAKEKIKIITGKPPLALGWMPIAGDEFVYEMTVRALLLPGANGVPTWNSDEPGERETIKLPGQFSKLASEKGPLSEDVGERFAKWAAGDVTPQATKPATQSREPGDDEEPPPNSLQTDPGFRGGQ